MATRTRLALCATLAAGPLCPLLLAGEPCDHLEIGTRTRAFADQVSLLGSADLDGDGRVELFLRTNDARLSVLTQGSCVDLAPRQAISAPNGAVSNLAIPMSGDLDGDGELDLLVENGDHDFWCAGLGDGRVGPAHAIDIDAERFAIGDLDGDGTSELVMSGGQASGLAVLRLEAGAFTQVGTIGSVPYGGSIAVVDLNGDGALDVVAVNEQSTLDFFANDGTGGFGAVADDSRPVDLDAVVPISIDAQSRGVAFASAGDLCAVHASGAALIDAVTVDTPWTFLWQLRDASGFPAGSGVYGLAKRAHGLLPGRVDIASWDAGGANPRVESIAMTQQLLGPIVTTHGPTSGSAAIITIDDQNATHSVIATHVVDTNGHRHGTTIISDDIRSEGFTIADFDSDGIDDIVNTGFNGLRTHFGTPDGSFIWNPSDDIPVNVLVVETADMTGDGVLDLVAPSLSLGLLIFPGDGQGGWLPTLPAAPIGDWAFSIEIGDLDGDGDMDVVLPQQSPAAVAIYHNNGAGGLTLNATHQLGSSSSYCQSITMADYDGNGIHDVVCGVIAYQQNWLVRLDGIGDGTFAIGAPIPTASTGGARVVASGDWTGDGRPDIAIVTRPSGWPDLSAEFLANDGNGNFSTEHWMAVGGTRSYSCELRDLDANGTPELIIATYHGVRVLKRSDSEPRWRPLGIARGDAAPHDPVDIAVYPRNGTPRLIITGGLGSKPMYLSTIGCLCPPSSHCAADIVGLDGQIGFVDLLRLLGSWGPCDDPFACAEDVDGDGQISIDDLTELLGAWGDCDEA